MAAARKSLPLLLRRSLGLRGLSTTSAAGQRASIAPAESTISWDSHVPVKLRMEESGPGSVEPVLVQTMLKRAVEENAHHYAVSIKRDGEWKNWTYEQYYQDLLVVGKAFLALGLER